MRKSNITRLSLEDRSRGSTDWAAGDAVFPEREGAISIRLDRDLVDHFKRGGNGYQRRINAVLRADLEARAKQDRA